jgi:hypothetical protein
VVFAPFVQRLESVNAARISPNSTFLALSRKSTKRAFKKSGFFVVKDGFFGHERWHFPVSAGRKKKGNTEKVFPRSFLSVFSVAKT